MALRDYDYEDEYEVKRNSSSYTNGLRPNSNSSRYYDQVPSRKGDNIEVVDFVSRKTNNSLSSRRSNSTVSTTRNVDRGRDLERMRQRSTSGSSARRIPNNKKKVSHKSSAKRIKATLAVTGLLIVGLCKMVPSAMDAMATNAAIHDMNNTFRVEAVAPNVHRCANPADGYWYDYREIMDYIEHMDNYDEGIYFLQNNIELRYNDDCMKYSDYGSMQGFYDAHGYKDREDFRDSMKDKLALELDIDKKTEELQAMETEHGFGSTEQENIEYMASGK